MERARELPWKVTNPEIDSVSAPSLAGEDAELHPEQEGEGGAAVHPGDAPGHRGVLQHLPPLHLLLGVGGDVFRRSGLIR